MGLLYKLKKLKQNHNLKQLHIGDHSRVGIDVKINNPQNVYIGTNSYINSGMIHVGNNSKVQIGNNCLLSYNIHIRTTSHNYMQKDILIREQGEYEKDIIIEDDCWIGYGAQIMPGVTLHKGCVVGAGAIVTKDVEAYAVVVGCPARKIKSRM